MAGTSTFDEQNAWQNVYIMQNVQVISWTLLQDDQKLIQLFAVEFSTCNLKDVLNLLLVKSFWLLHCAYIDKLITLSECGGYLDQFLLGMCCWPVASQNPYPIMVYFESLLARIFLPPKFRKCVTHWECNMLYSIQSWKCNPICELLVKRALEDEWKERLRWFHTTFWMPGTLVME